MPFQQMIRLKSDTIRQGLLPPTNLSGEHPTDSHLLATTNRQCIPAHTGLDAGDAVSELQGRGPVEAACSKVQDGWFSG